MITNIQLLKDLADFTSSPVAIYTGIDLKVEFINTAMFGFWRVNNAKSYFEMLPPEMEGLSAQALTAFNTGEPSHAENKKFIYSDKGTDCVRYFNCSFLPLTDQSGQVYGVLNTQSDVTELNDIKNKSERDTEDLMRSNLDLLHFANTVSHDLREPVRKIKIYNSYLQNETSGSQNEKWSHYHNKIDQSAQRMEELIEGILDYSALNREKQPLKKISLNKLFASILIDLELVIKDKKASVTFGELPDITGAPILIHQLFYNLVQNALKFSKNGASPVVFISSMPLEKDNIKSVMIIIKDNGIGLEQQYAEKIFTAFERLNSKDEFKGSGLGLALCRRITDRHKGAIIAKGILNQGSEFSVTLPIHHNDKFI